MTAMPGIGLLLACGLLLTGGAAPALAGPWEVTPRVRFSHTVTDNVNRAATSREAESDSVSQVNAGLTARRAGGRTALDLAYNLRGMAYWDDDQRNRVDHQFRANSTTELLRESLFLDASASYDQRILDAREGLGQDAITAGDNQTDVFRYRLSPYWRRAFGRVAMAQVRYGHEGVDYVEAEADAADSTTHRLQASLNSGPMFTTLGWGLSYNREESDYEDGSAVTFETLEALLRLNLSPRFSLYAAGGEERNDFEQDPGRARPDDTFWRAGFDWAPTVRTSLGGFYGERFFGDTYGLDLRHRSRLANWRLSYAETVDSLSGYERVDTLQELQGEDVFIIFNPETFTLEAWALVPDTYVSKRLDFTVSGERRRLSWSVTALRDDRSFETGRGDEQIEALRFNLGLEVAPRTQLRANGGWQWAEYRPEGREDDLLTLGLGVTRQLGPRTTAALDLRRQERDSTTAGGDYEENRLTASLTATF
ncbi:TIGR03016 family PEP-CTERM system-associated outer membrane protein [Ectothiorhodospira mobilis]|uniref:TIGR03016 family PEP-CTERM system-associated outer membrane protein n=1 Tax=Ectothiorhodospira mobilis TaxID=195064 RepID=UPI0019066389|nr:TIGR03016 family PEP-CTERM system-associated outer membrane protein [Ectothiorhodospira mobilis]MBK1691671.1 TIGR03016 family PEP-CTERM system-associated outer membrane protein [Ectothiorhodospira mobilis]